MENTKGLSMEVTITEEDLREENPVMHAMLRQTRESIDRYIDKKLKDLQQ